MSQYAQKILDFETRRLLNNSMNGMIIKMKSGNEVNLEKD